MSLFAQHGHGKSTKIQDAYDDESLDGVIFAARNEKPDKLQKCVEALRAAYDGQELLLDPQFYVSNLAPPNNRYLEEYPYYSQGLGPRDFTGAAKLQGFAKNTLDYQMAVEFDGLLSPTVMFDSFTDRWHQTALNLADASLEYHASLSEPPPLLLSFVFSEEALGGREEIDRFLDTVTQDSWNMDGFYLVIARSEDGYQQRFDAMRLANYLYMVYVLGHLNGFRVICGYSDFCGLLLRAGGAKAFATGWSQSLRKFERKAFIKRKSGGQAPRVRYSSSKLFNSIYMTELQQIDDVGYLDQVLSGVDLDDAISGASSPEAASWNTVSSQRHHWQTLAQMDEEFGESVATNVRGTIARLREALALYAILEAEGVQFDRNTGKDHLRPWIEALTSFQRMAGFARD